VTEQLSLAKDTIADMQTRQRDVAALDAKYTKELADEKLKMMLCSASLIMVVGARQRQVSSVSRNPNRRRRQHGR
jgi:hypothetical protein